MQYRTDYILGTDPRLFRNFSVSDLRHNSNHYIFLSCLHRDSLKEHARYLGGRKKLTLCPLTKPMRQDTISAALQRAVTKPRAQKAQKNAWILAATWRIADERVSARRDLAKYQTLIWRMGRAIRANLKTDRRQRAEEAGPEV